MPEKKFNGEKKSSIRTWIPNQLYFLSVFTEIDMNKILLFDKENIFTILKTSRLVQWFHSSFATENSYFLKFTNKFEIDRNMISFSIKL